MLAVVCRLGTSTTYAYRYNGTYYNNILYHDERTSLFQYVCMCVYTAQGTRLREIRSQRH